MNAIEIETGKNLCDDISYRIEQNFNAEFVP